MKFYLYSDRDQPYLYNISTDPYLDPEYFSEYLREFDCNTPEEVIDIMIKEGYHRNNFFIMDAYP